MNATKNTDRYAKGTPVSQYTATTCKTGTIGKAETFHGTDGQTHEGRWIHWNDGTSCKVTVKDLDKGRNGLCS